MSSAVDFLAYVLAASVPYVLAGEGMTLAGRSGIFLILNEGVMLSSASAAFLVSYFTGDIFLGAGAGVLVGAGFGFLMSFFSVTLRQDQFVVGLGLYILGTGFATLLYRAFIGIVFIPPISRTVTGVQIPVLSDLPVVGPVLFSQNLLFYAAVLVAIASWFFLYKTRYGLIVRSVGESPRVADSLGTNVIVARYGMTVLGTMLIGLGGAYVPLFFTGTYTNSLISGRGWISILLPLFGNWQPLIVLLGAFIFAGVETSALYAQLLGARIPSQVLLMTPFITMLLLAIQSYRHADVPRGLGKPYDRESIED